MSDGILDFVDNGIDVYSSVHSFTENITGGIIRTNGEFVVENANLLRAVEQSSYTAGMMRQFKIFWELIITIFTSINQVETASYRNQENYEMERLSNQTEPIAPLFIQIFLSIIY